MTADNRPHPEEFLKRLQQEEALNAPRTTGRLKIFLGFCAGVGKTYRMLEEAKLAVKHGINTVIGVVETHGRKETQALLEGLTILPCKQVEYNGIQLAEMDIDTLLELKPELVIVDELAHTNIPNSRHEKRYQDVEELLNAGINVFTTLNIQHVTSQLDIVQQISYITIHEAVPDSILELADEIELIDLTPEKLLERLEEGKIYIPEKARQATQKFFRKGNLLALRELALRYTAKRVDEDMLSYKQQHEIKTPWSVCTRLLVGFSSHPASERLLKITHRMASEMGADWHAVHVESTHQQIELSDKARNQLEKNTRLAEELGAKIALLTGTAIADTLIDYAKGHNVTLIVVGLSYRSKMEELFKGSVLNELTKKSGPLDILIVGNNNKPKILESYFTPPKKDTQPYFISILCIAPVILIGCLTREWFDPFNIGMLLLLPVIASSILWELNVGLFAAIVAIGAFDFFLIPPFYTFAIEDLKYLPSFFVFIAIALIVSVLAKSMRWQTETTKHRERFLSSLYAFSREIMSAHNLEEILEKASTHISEAFQSDVVILLPNERKELQVVEKHGTVSFNEKEKAVALWVYKNGVHAGRNTQTLASANWHYLPLKSENLTFGVLGFTPTQQACFLSSEQQRLLDSFANILGLFLKKNNAQFK
jgi:two-component system sensor histidine kinase KdpD